MSNNHPNRSARASLARNPTSDDWLRVVELVGGRDVLWQKIQHRGISRFKLASWIDGEARCHPATFAYILAQVGMLTLPEDTGHGFTATKTQPRKAQRFEERNVKTLKQGDHVAFGSLRRNPPFTRKVKAIVVYSERTTIQWEPGDANSNYLNETNVMVAI